MIRPQPKPTLFPYTTLFRSKTILNFAASLVLVNMLSAAELPREQHPVVVHEWGTFTSIATETGAPSRWAPLTGAPDLDRKSTRLNSSHLGISYAVFCLKKKK